MIRSKTAATISMAVAICLLAGCGAVFVNEGSRDASLADGVQDPNANKPKLNVPADEKIISNFDDGSTNVDSRLYGGDGGYWISLTFDGNSVNSNYVVAGGANGTPKAAHIFGSLVDKSDGQYPTFTLQCNLKKSGMYDASNFDGIEFYYKCPADDQAVVRRFNLGIAETVPPQDGGNCQGDCYNHFGAFLQPSNDWTLCKFKFSDLTRQTGWGSPVTPPDLTDHLAEFIDLSWNHGGNNNAGTYNIDYWVDEVQFF